MTAAGVVAVCFLIGPAAAGEDIDSPDHWRAGWKRMGALGRGFVVWESNRGGAYRIWTRNMDGSGLRRVSPDEKGRWHYSPHLSPDGRRLVYLSYPPNRWQDGYAPTPPGKRIPMHLINTDGTGDRVLVPNARTYLSHRSAVWLNPRELIYIDGNGFTRQVNVDTGKSYDLTREGNSEYGWLINATKTHATSRAIWITFSRYDRKAKTVIKTKIYGGCMPYFTRDGVWGFYMGGSGGPIQRVWLATGKISPIVGIADPRMPPARRHLYYPMLSANSRLLAFGAAPKKMWERDPRSDYDIFVAHCDPRTLTVIGKPVRYTFNKAQDRYPDVFLAPAPGTIAPAAPVKRPGAPGRARPAWPTRPKGLVFLWEDSQQPNLTRDPATGRRRAYRLNFRGRSWLDHNYAIHLVGRGFVDVEEAGDAIAAACKDTGALSVAATIVSADYRQGAISAKAERPARILTLVSNKNPAKAHFSLAQASNELFFSLDAGANAPQPRWARLNCCLRTGRASVLVTYAAGVLTAYLDGQVVFESKGLKGDLSRWSPARLLLGGSSGGKQAWSGTLEGVAIYNRAVGPEEAWADYRRYAAKVRARKPVPKLHVDAKLLARALVPDPKDLGTYRKALVVCEYELVQSRGPGVAPKRFRVAHWGILDREPQGLSKRALGRTYRMVLEPFDANPQLKTAPLRDTPLPLAPDLPLYFETGR